jgi:hypothetical protein
VCVVWVCFISPFLCILPSRRDFLFLKVRASSCLHYDASAAALLIRVVVHAHLLDAVGAVAARGRARVRRHLLIVPADFPDNVVEGVVDVDARFRRRLDEFAAKVLGKGLALCAGVSDERGESQKD